MSADSSVSFAEGFKILGIELSPMDAAALAVFVGGWAAYVYVAEHVSPKHTNLRLIMAEWRETWMLEMLSRENRMVDIQIVNNLQRNTTFFASTTMLILAGLAAAFGGVEKLQSVTSELPFVEASSRAALELKILLLILGFIYAFFKFSWSIRLHSFTAVLLGASPEPDPARPALSEADVEYGRELARISTLASEHYNNGIRAYCFGLAAVTGFVNSAFVILATVWVILVLYRREFRSRSLRHLMGAKAARGRANS